MDIVVKGRHTAVPERFRGQVQTKLAKLERLDTKLMRVDVELSREHNPRLSQVRDRVELTVYSRGPVIRAEAAAADPYTALDKAGAKLMERLRRAADRRIRRHANHAGANHRGVGRAGQPALAGARGQTEAPAGQEAGDILAAEAEPEYSPMVVREKVHEAVPMTLDDALSNMELVGHDFYLFVDADSGLPSVVYRRKGYDYGVIRLAAPSGAGATGGTARTPERTPAVASAV